MNNNNNRTVKLPLIAGRTEEFLRVPDRNNTITKQLGNILQKFQQVHHEHGGFEVDQKEGFVVLLLED